MGLTNDPNDPCLDAGSREGGQNKCYLVLSDEERSLGFVRPVRRSYVHVGRPGPRFELVDLTDEQCKVHDGRARDYVKYEPYPESESPSVGRYWTQEQLDAVGKGCGAVTTMGQEIAETYAREPGFYGRTFCVGCKTHLPVGKDGEFVWDGTEERVGS